ncbi:hypothetical protein DFH27DRAFT_240007 [Peziza echinospora]|nr:hypothetical protein DFH27DRAFT_240007 [Peziza echinospora]
MCCTYHSCWKWCTPTPLLLPPPCLLVAGCTQSLSILSSTAPQTGCLLLNHGTAAHASRLISCEASHGCIIMCHVSISQCVRLAYASTHGAPRLRAAPRPRPRPHQALPRILPDAVACVALCKPERGLTCALSIFRSTHGDVRPPSPLLAHWRPPVRDISSPAVPSPCPSASPARLLHAPALAAAVLTIPSTRPLPR